jgi:hypothetical protein
LRPCCHRFSGASRNVLAGGASSICANFQPNPDRQGHRYMICRIDESHQTFYG